MNLEDSIFALLCGMKEYKYSDERTINEMGIGDGEVIKGGCRWRSDDGTEDELFAG